MKIVKGHIDRVVNMVDRGEYCIDVIHQSQAVQAALKKVDQEILKNHMETCVAEAIKEGKTKDVVDEVMKVIRKS